MTESSKHNLKKGMAMVSWVLFIALFIAASATVINMIRNKAEIMTEETAEYAENKILCQPVKLTNTSNTTCLSNPQNMSILNIGGINIKKLSAQLDGGETITLNWEIPAYTRDGTIETMDKASQEIGITTPFSTITFVPIIEHKGQLIKCSAKTHTIKC